MLRVLLGVTALLFAAGGARAAEKELHVVAPHVGHDTPRDRSTPGTASVTVDRPGKEVVLVVHAYNPIAWDVRATPKTTLVKVLAVGYHRQSVTAPKGVEVEELTYDGKKAGVSKAYIYGDYQVESAGFRPFVRKLFDHTGSEIASFQGIYQFDPDKPFVVDAVQKDERLSSDFPKLPPAAQIPKLKVEATRLVFVDRGDTKTGYGEFTQAGPTADGFVALPKGILQVAYDPNAKLHYGISGHDLHVVNMKAKASIKIGCALEKQPNWLRALTYDAKRDRVLISGRNALYEYSTKGGGQWSVLIDGNKGSFSALTWQKSTDTLFAIAKNEQARENRNAPLLYELNSAGAVVNVTALKSPMFTGAMESGVNDRAELIDLGGDLAALIYRENRNSGNGDRGKPETFLYVIDPKTGKTKLAWKE